MFSRAARAQKALQHAAEQLDALGKTAGVSIKGKVIDLVKEADHWVDVMAASQMPKGSWTGAGLSWTEPNTRAIDAIVKRSTQQVESLLRPLSREAQREMKTALIRGVAAGQNPRVAAKRMIRQTKGAFDGGLPRAQNIAQTEMLDAARASALESRKANPAVTGWIWWADLSSRTCGSCLAMHGSVHPADEPGPLDHVRGRCSAVPKTLTWKELGLDIKEPEHVKVQSGKEWFDKQPEKVQREIVGPTRLKALNDGRIEFSDLAVRRTNGQWRDSFAMPAVASLPT